jgi:putative restriction endonuclease
MAALADYLDMSAVAARDQWRRILARPRRPDDPKFRQVDFLPAETLLCLAASILVNHRSYGGSTSDKAPPPVPELARLFRRTPASILAKMANLDGSRPNGARHEVETAATLLADPVRLTGLYQIILEAARAEGVGPVALPDFLGGGFHLLGQEELTDHDVEVAVIGRLGQLAGKMGLIPEAVTERLLVAATRVGQHRFAVGVLTNCGHRCVFCGLSPGDDLAGKGLLLASHIKPWRDSTDRERLDIRNGLAACPTHDAAFDRGLLWVNGGLAVHRSGLLTRATDRDTAMATVFGQPGLARGLLLPNEAAPPGAAYLAWHRERIAVEFD